MKDLIKHPTKTLIKMVSFFSDRINTNVLVGVFVITFYLLIFWFK